MNILEKLKHSSQQNTCDIINIKKNIDYLLTLGITIKYNVLNYSELLLVNDNQIGNFAYVQNSQGINWLPGTLGGIYYNKGIYYYDGVSWKTSEIPYQASLQQVIEGVNNELFVTPFTLKNVIDSNPGFQGSVDLSGKVDKEINKSLISDTLITKISEFNTFTLSDSFYIQNGILYSNISQIKTTFIYQTGQLSTFILPFTPTNLIGVFVNGLKLYKSDQYSITLPNEINILQTLFNYDVIDFVYEHYINTPL